MIIKFDNLKDTPNLAPAQLTINIAKHAIGHTKPKADICPKIKKNSISEGGVK